MVELTDDLFIGKGTARICYLDPRDPSRCIKVHFGDRSRNQTKLEAKYYRKLARLKPDFQYGHVPRFHGFVETNHGVGGVFDVVRDEKSGAISKPIRHYLYNGAMDRDRPRWEKAFRDFQKEVLHHGVMVGDLKPGNICARISAEGSIQLVVVDGIGHRCILPLCDYIPAIARRKLAGQLARFGLGSVENLKERERRKVTERSPKKRATA